MNKQNIYFLSGFPRSGATLLSSILEQNPEVHCPPASPLIHLMATVYNCYNSPQNIDYDRQSQIFNVLNGIAPSFFIDRNEPVIIDKNWAWVQDNMLELIYRHITTNIKIICPVRSIPQIVNSFLSILNENESENDNNLIDKTIAHIYGEVNNDNRARYVLNELIDVNYKAIKNKFNHKLYKQSFLLITYDSLLAKPSSIIDRIYDFLGEPPFKHDYNKIINPYEKHASSKILTQLHHVRETICLRSNKDYLDTLSPEVRTKIMLYPSFWEYDSYDNVC